MLAEGVSSNSHSNCGAAPKLTASFVVRTTVSMSVVGLADIDWRRIRVRIVSSVAAVSAREIRERLFALPEALRQAILD